MTGHSKSGIEVEAKFQGGQPECDRIFGWFEESGFAVKRKAPVHRAHVYFDDQDRLRASGCRLRCIIASGEWCRYDFKVDDPTGRGETQEVSLKKTQPISLPEAVAGLAASLDEGPVKSALLSVAMTAQVILVMTGTHQKCIASGHGLELEISWDLLIPLESGVPLSEIEIELLRGARSDFDACIQAVERKLGLTRSDGSKLEKALACKNDVKCNKT